MGRKGRGRTHTMIRHFFFLIPSAHPGILAYVENKTHSTLQWNPGL